MSEPRGGGLRLLALSLAATLAVAAYSAIEKVRIDARAHFAEAESLRPQALARATRAELETTGLLYARTMASCTPLDPLLARASDALVEVARTLLAAREPGAAARVLDAGLASIDGCSGMFHPLVAEREEIAGLRQSIVLAAAGPGAPAGSAGGVGGPGAPAGSAGGVGGPELPAPEPSANPE